MGERREFKNVLGDLYKYSFFPEHNFKPKQTSTLLLKTNECLNNMQRKKCNELIRYRNMIDL